MSYSVEANSGSGTFRGLDPEYQILSSATAVTCNGKFDSSHYWAAVCATYMDVADRYWVHGSTSGTGNWSDTAHWSTISGGAGGASTPDAIYNTRVHFDAHSFSAVGQTVTQDGNGFAAAIDSAAAASWAPILGSQPNTFDATMVAGDVDLSGFDHVSGGDQLQLNPDVTEILCAWNCAAS